MKMIWSYIRERRPIEDYYFLIPKVCLRFMGYWSGERLAAGDDERPQKEHCSKFIWPMVNFLILFVGVATELHAGFTAFGYDIEIALDTLCPAGTSAVTLLKMILLSYYRNDLAQLLAQTRQKLYPKENEKNVEKRCVIRSYSLMAFRINCAALMLAFITCTSYNLKPLLVCILLKVQGKELIWETPFNMTMPSVFLHGPFFAIGYLFTAYTGYITICIFSGCDALYFEFCSYLAALLSMLENDFLLLFNKHEEKEMLSDEDSVKFEAELIELIKRHQDIIYLQKYFLHRYTIITLAHFVSAGLVIGISIYDLMTFSGPAMLIYVAYTFAALSELFLYCYGGTLVTESSILVTAVFSKCHWEICNARLRRLLLIIIMQSQRRLTMAVPFFVPSLATFTSILQTSGSIIALASSFENSKTEVSQI